MKAILNQLYQHKPLTRDQAKDVLLNITSEKYNSTQIAAFLSVYLMRFITVDELAGFRDAMLKLCLKTDFDSNESIDIVGTGGDGKNTFNISTLACFIVAATGIKVTKHGNYGVSSISGSSNVLEAIGYKFSNDSTILQKQLNEAGICFLHAPLFHPAMKSIAPIRRELGLKTFFNILGPILNPSFPKYQLIGVYNLELARLYHYLLQENENINYTIVHSLDGYDEISLTSEFKILSREKEEILHPQFINLKKLAPSDLYGGNSVDEAAKLFIKILSGEGTNAQNDAVCINAAMAIQTIQKNKSIQECFSIAKETLLSKKAHNIYKKLIN